MAGYKGRGSKVRVKDSTGTYKLIPGVQDIVLSYPTVGTLDVSDQETLSGVLELLPGEPSEGTLEFTINFNVQEPTHILLYNAMRAQTTIDRLRGRSYQVPGPAPRGEAKPEIR